MSPHKRTFRLLAVLTSLALVWVTTTASSAGAAEGLDSEVVRLVRLIDDPDDSVGPPRWLVALISEHFPASERERAFKVSFCESRWDPDAENPRSSATGLFQFLRKTWNWVADSTGSPSFAQGGPYDPEWAVRNAAWLAENGGWQHWAPSRACWRNIELPPLPTLDTRSATQGELMSIVEDRLTLHALSARSLPPVPGVLVP